MAASSLRDELDHVHLCGAPGLERQRFLPVLALYGANAAGKSTMLQAATAVFRCVEHSYALAVAGNARGALPYDPPRFLEQSPELSSRFDVDVVLHDIRYHYGFEVGPEGVNAEWLYRYPRRSRTLMFERSFSAERDATVRFGAGAGKSDETLMNLAKDRSFLLFSAVGSIGTHPLRALQRAFVESFTSIDRDSAFNDEHIAAVLGTQPSMLKRVEDFLKLADTGIVGLEIKRMQRAPTATHLLRGLHLLMRDVFPETHASDSPPILDEVDTLEFVHRGHAGKTFRLAPTDESAGTLGLLALLVPAIRALEQGKVLIVDEINTTLHTALSQALVGVFANKCVNRNGAQIIFSTHDAKLLNPAILRRDEIWFAAKDSSGATTVYPLTDFRTRKSDNVERSYIEGRYGAVPFFGDIASLFGEYDV